MHTYIDKYVNLHEIMQKFPNIHVQPKMRANQKETQRERERERNGAEQQKRKPNRRPSEAAAEEFELNTAKDNKQQMCCQSVRADERKREH